MVRMIAGSSPIRYQVSYVYEKYCDIFIISIVKDLNNNNSERSLKCIAICHNRREHELFCYEIMVILQKPTVKHPFEVHVWAGISRFGKTRIMMFTGIMKKEFYVHQILTHGLLPFIQRMCPENHRFQQDNDPKHKSAYAKENKIRYWPTPAESPDLNPIEMMWAELKQNLRRVVKPKNKEELITGIKQFWESVTIGKCNIYIDHLNKVLPVVLERGGKATGH